MKKRAERLSDSPQGPESLRTAKPRRASRAGHRLRLLGLLLVGLAAATGAAFYDAPANSEPTLASGREPTTPISLSLDGYVRAVSVDPADYAEQQPDARVLAEDLVERFAANGVNLVYVNAYNVAYGAYYRTDYEHNRLSAYGRQDLLGHLIEAAHAKDIKVFAAVYDHQHEGAWEANPAWRAKTASGDDYVPEGSDVQHYLSIAHPEARRWWMGFLADLVERHPRLDGVELREPIVNWYGVEADYNEAFTAAFRKEHPRAALGGEEWLDFRARQLTDFLEEETRLIHARGLDVHVTTVAYAHPDGTLLTSAEERRTTGFDVEAVLAADEQPDALKAEFIWQQWAKAYGRAAFGPRWTRQALEDYLARTGAHERLIAHIELTDFGRVGMSVDEFYQTLLYAQAEGIAGVDFYSSGLADVKQAWPAVKAAYREEPLTGVKRDARALVLYDAPKAAAGAGGDEGGSEGDSEGDSAAELARLQAVYWANLLGHFPIKWELAPVESYRAGDAKAYDYLLYQGSVYGNAPSTLVEDVKSYDGKVVWVGQNLFQLEDAGHRLPFGQAGDALALDGHLDYRGRHLPAEGEVLPTRLDAQKGQRSVLAWMSAEEGYYPYLLHAKNLWYVAGSPFSFLGEGLNGRYLAFADVLHDVFASAPKAPKAFVRVESVTPRTDPRKLEELVEVFARREAPFLVSVVPFHVEDGHETSLSERPALIEALKRAEAAGGVVVMNGATHQLEGESGLEPEFWSLATQSGRKDDSDALVRTKLERGLEELWEAGLHPLAFETPHYAATAFDYAVFGDYFSTFVERRLYGVHEGDAYIQSFPYLIEQDGYGAMIVPENLGRLDELVGPNQLLERARRLSVVRGALVGGFVHPYTSPSQVATLLDGLARAGYAYLDLHTLPNVVSTAERVEATGAGKARLLVPTGKVLAADSLNRDGGKLGSDVVGYGRQSLGVPRGASLVSLKVLSEVEGEAAKAAAKPGGVDLLASGIIAMAAAGILLMLATYLHLRVGRPA